MYNPGTLPGMNMGSFQYNSQKQQQQINPNSTESKYAYLGFNPSQVNNAKMSFDINSQLGIDGKSQSFGGQAFTGGYDRSQRIFDSILRSIIFSVTVIKHSSLPGK